MKKYLILLCTLSFSNIAHADSLKIIGARCSTSPDGKSVIVNGFIENDSKQLVKKFKVTPYLLDKFGERINAPASSVIFNNLKPWNSYNFVAQVKLSVNEYDGCSATIERL